VLAVGVLLAGCTTYYSKPGATEAQFQRDLYECQYQAAALPYAPPPPAPTGPYASAGMPGYQMQVAGGNLAAAANRKKVEQQCMAARGYSTE